MAYTTINKPIEHFSTNLWVADDTSPRSFTGFGHQPDFVWVKHRGSGSVGHCLLNSVRGGDKFTGSNNNTAENTSKPHGYITSFNSDGITVADGTNPTYPRLYFNDLDPFGSGGGNYVCWSWKANGGTGSANTDGSITSTVSANTTSGFSIVTYTGTGSNATVGHGLGAVPKMIITKSIASSNWGVYHESLGNTDALFLNETSATGSSSNYWNNTSPTSSVFYLGNGGTNGGSTNNTGGMIAYCFADKTGYSKFGSYVGNGNADGTFVYTGFKPAFVMLKSSSSAGDSWFMFDDKRTTSNVMGSYLRAEGSNAEGSDTALDFLSNGFKLRSTSGAFNDQTTFVYMAFASAPLVGTNNVPCTAR